MNIPGLFMPETQCMKELMQDHTMVNTTGTKRDHLKCSTHPLTNEILQFKGKPGVRLTAQQCYNSPCNINLSYQRKKERNSFRGCSIFRCRCAYSLIRQDVNKARFRCPTEEFDASATLKFFHRALNYSFVSSNKP